MLKKNEVIYRGEVYRYAYSKTLDKDGNGIKETMLYGFENIKDAKKKIGRYLTNGNNWAWFIFGDYDRKEADSDVMINFVLVNNDNKGGFDTRISVAEEFSLPEWIKRTGK